MAIYAGRLSVLVLSSFLTDVKIKIRVGVKEKKLVFGINK